MTIYTFPSIAPSSIDPKIIYNTKTLVSPLNGYTQTASREGTRWHISQRFTNLFGDDRADLMAFLARMNGQTHRAKIYLHTYHGARGALGGTPLVDGAGQTGSTLNIKGMSAGLDSPPTGVANIFKAGDQISYLNANSNWELKLVLANASSDGSGLVSVEISPEIHTSPANETAIITTNPAGTFMLLSPEIGWSERPDGNSTYPIHSDFSIDWIEDIT